jgi:hypothetical protein
MRLKAQQGQLSGKLKMRFCGKSLLLAKPQRL